MRDIFDQDRPMTLGAVKLATAVLGLIFLVAAALILLSGLGTVFSGRPMTGLLHIVVGFGLLGFLFVTVRLLGEILAALHRLNDRIVILGDDIRNPRRDETLPAGKAKG